MHSHFDNHPQSEFILRTSVRSALLEKTLFMSSCGAIFGLFILFFSYFHLNPSSYTWASFCWWIGVFIIAFSFIPYKQLSYKELHPDILLIDTEAVHLIRYKRTALRIPLDSIHDAHFLVISNGPSGIALRVDRDQARSLHLPFDIKKAAHKIRRHTVADFPSTETLLLPHFTEKGARELKELIEDRSMKKKDEKRD